jgi:hypothetical protein
MQGASMSSGEPEATDEGKGALQKYRKGMWDLGWGLVVLAAFQIVGCALSLALTWEIWILILLGGMATIDLVLGLLILRKQAWANYIVVVWSASILATSLASMAMQADPQRASFTPGSCLGLLLAGVLLYAALKNIWSLRRVRAASLKP